jgi:hypothetical protein
MPHLSDRDWEAQAAERLAAGRYDLEACAVEPDGSVILWNPQKERVVVRPEDASSVTALLFRHKAGTNERINTEQMAALVVAVSFAPDRDTQHQLRSLYNVLIPYLTPEERASLPKLLAEPPPAGQEQPRSLRLG